MAYTACGKQISIDYDATTRISLRVRCKLALPRPSLSNWMLTLPKRAKEEIPFLATFFLTSEIATSCDLGDFLFIAAATLGTAEATARRGESKKRCDFEAASVQSKTRYSVIFPGVFTKTDLHMKNFLRPFQLLEFLSGNDSRVFHEGVQTRATFSIATPEVFDLSLRRRLDIRNPPNNTRKSHAKVAVLRGSFRSWKYFHKYKALLDYQFVFDEQIYEQAVKNLLPVIRGKNNSTVLVGVHVSRQEALKPGLASYGYIPADKRYFEHAFASMNEKYASVAYFIVGDDLSWCRQAFANITDATFVESVNSAVDLATLSLADHLILSVGSLGWWAAYLSDVRDVIYYKHWPKPQSGMAQVYSHRDYFLPHWTAMD